jgi:DNA-directed DNA polymerase III PolC
VAFVHLHRHSRWSLLDGTGDGDSYAQLAAEKGFSAIGLTDHGTLAGVLEHIAGCSKAGIMPIIGCELYMRPNRLDHTPRVIEDAKGKKKSIAPQRWHLTLLAMNFTGWINLQRVVSETYKSGLYYRPCADFDLLQRHNEGIYCMLGCIGGMFAGHLQAGGLHLNQYLQVMRSIYGDNLSAEIMPHDFDGQREVNIDTINACNDASIPVAVTGDAHMLTPEWASVQDAMLMLSTGQSNLKRKAKQDAGEDIYTMHQENPTLWLMSEQEMAASFAAFHPHIPASTVQAGMNHTGEIISKFTPFYLDRQIKMPFIGHEIVAKIDDREPDPKFEPDELVVHTLNRWCLEGLEELKAIYPPEHWHKFPVEQYERQIAHEINVLKNVGMHAVRYMLMVAGEIRWARRNDIIVGPGRGSAAGSLVAYLSGITDIDPIPYRLKFGRFINPGRKGMPDIDVDFMPGAAGKDRVIQHTAEVYGAENVIPIAAYGTYGPRKALADTCRVFDDLIDFPTAQRYQKAIDLKPTEKDDLEDCAKRFPEIAEFKQRYPTLWHVATKIEGHPFSQSSHASGVLVKPSGIEMPTAAKIDKATGERTEVTMWPDTKELLANYGWLKIDYLVIEGLIRQHEVMKALRDREGTPIDLRALPVRWDPEAVDPAVMDQFCHAKTLGVWQMEGKATLPLLKAIQPSNMHDLAAINALIRPGAREGGITEEYAKRKHGEIPESEWYWHPSVEEILRPTYGLMVYQEQAMEIVQALGGFSEGEADDMRKAMGKKYREGMAAVIAFLDDLGYEQKWMDSASGIIGEALARDLWVGKLLPFGKYSFNACLTGDTVVVRGGSGGRGSANAATPEITIAELYEAQESRTAWGAKLRDPNRGIRITQMDSDGRIRLGKMKRVIYNGRCDVYEIVTEGGRTIKATTNHRFLTDNGYRHVDEISRGSMLVVAGEKEPPTSQRLNGRGKGHVRGNTYDGQGFQTGQANPAWLDGRTQALEEAKHQVVQRAGAGCCERCLEIHPVSGSHTLEFAHQQTLEQCGGDYLRFHSAANIAQLCNSCHKQLDYDKGERKKRWTRGLPTELDRVESVTYVGVEAVYDIEMDTPEHNFVANGIVSHNSHAYSYSLISYHDMLFKTIAPADFYAWLLTFTDSKNLSSKLAASLREGRGKISVKAPDINYSGLGFKVLDRETILYGIESVKGIGPAGSKAIFENRPFTSYEDFCQRIKPKDVKAPAREALIGVGAFDAFGMRDHMTDQEKATNELGFIGIKITGKSDIDQYAELIEQTIHTEEEFLAAPHKEDLCVGGEITGIKQTATKRDGSQMGFVNLAFGQDEYRVTLFPKTWAAFSDKLIEGQIVFFEGQKDVSEQYGHGFIANDCVTLAELLALEAGRHSADTLSPA